MNKNYVVLSFIVMIMIASLFPGYGEENAEDVVSVPRKLCLFLLFGDTFKEEDTFLFQQTLMLKLAEDKDISLVEPVMTEEMPLTQRHEKAEDLGADCWLAVQLSSREEIIEIRYSSYDLLKDTFTIEEKKYEKSAKIRNLQRSFWRDIIVDIAQHYSQTTGKLEIKEVIEYQSDIKDALEERGVKVVFEATPGTRIQGLPEDSLVVSDRGIAKTELARASTYRIKASCAGYYPLEKSFYVGNEPVKVTLEQQPASRFGCDLFLHQADYLGAGFLFYIVPNYIFTEISATTYMKKLIWPVEKETSDWESPLFPVFFTAGFYVNEEDDLFRYGFTTGVFIRFFYDDNEGSIILDRVSSWGIKVLGFHAELSGYKKIRFFYEHTILIYATENPSLLKAAIDRKINPESMVSGIYFIDFEHVINFFDIKLGVRFLF
jgi:hypothetical protein